MTMYSPLRGRYRPHRLGARLIGQMELSRVNLWWQPRIYSVDPAHSLNIVWLHLQANSVT